MFDVLLDELLDLNERLTDCGIRLILGGGMGLFLRDTYYTEGTRSPRYAVKPESRSTADLDLLLSADVIVDADKMNQLRDVLGDMDYEPEVKYLHFIREIDLGPAGPRTVKVDLLAAPPSDESRVKINPPRVRPLDSKGIHGYLTQEAAGIEIGAIAVDLGETSTSGGSESVVRIPSSFNYLLLKLHAFRDRKDREDDGSDRGRHHAFDIFRIVTDMRESDWDTARHHMELDGDKPYVKNAAQIQQSDFASPTSVGVLRLKENEEYRQNRDAFDDYIEDFLQDLAALFAGALERDTASDDGPEAQC